MFILRNKIIVCSIACLGLSQFVTQSSKAQSNAAGVFGLIGGMIAAAQMQAAKEAWAGQPEMRLYCAQKALARHDVTIPALIQNGVMPSDPRLAPIGSECAKFEPGNLKASYRCNALDENGATVVSTCNQSFGQTDSSGRAQVTDLRTAIDLYFSNGSFLLVDVESDSGRQQRYRQAERQRLIADLNALRGSVEGLQSSRSESVRAEAQKLAKRIASASGPKAVISASDVEAIRRDYKALAGFAESDNARLAALDSLGAARSRAEQKLSGEISQEIHDDFGALQVKYAEITQEAPPVFTIEKAQLAIGPTYDCTKAKDPLGKIICSDKELSRLDVDLLRPYYVVRFSAPDQRSTLKQEAVAFTQAVLQTCAIPEKGTVSSAAIKKAVPCVAAEYRRQRDQWQAQMAQSAPFSAREETGRPLDEHVQLQKLLQEIGYIPATEKADGIYGAGTRTAISNFQTAENIAVDGLLSDETAQRLLQRGAQTMAGGIDPSAQGQAVRLTELTKSYKDVAGRIDQFRAERAREKQLIATLAEAEAYASQKMSLPLPAKTIALLTGMKDEIAQVRTNPGMAALEHAVATFKQAKASTDEAVMVLNATTDKNRFLVEGEQSEILVLYNDGDKAPSLTKNLKGDLVFIGNKPSLCQRHDGSPEIGKARLLNGHFARYGQSFTFPLPRCDIGNLKAYDVIVAVRQALVSEKAADIADVLSAIDSGAFKLMFSVTDQDLNAALQAETARVLEIEKGVEDGSIKGLGFAMLKNDSKEVCLAIDGSEREAHALLLTPHMTRLTEEMKSTPAMKITPIEESFIAAKRGQCGAIYARENDLKSLTGALRRDQVAFRYLPILIDPDQVAKAREQATTNVTAQSQPSAVTRQSGAGVNPAPSEGSGSGISGPKAVVIMPGASEAEIPQDQYRKLCRSVSKSDFDSKCKGKKIVWSGSVAGKYSDDYGGSLRVDVEDGSYDLLMSRPQMDPEDLYFNGRARRSFSLA
ncbi:peptidoglycan-binding protein [Microvirga sp. BT689]|uniref:peptidoglycan-binding protein n=1 Tax=Microvirga arvi TaxID=2778731 RepID=UPI00194F351A|nr:peptidoglycan-binding protein [Microvirga arvi]MBM6580102.1 peptidoglycan-binding protein [Microvirga arvi]